jgi:hypothetical protein
MSRLDFYFTMAVMVFIGLLCVFGVYYAGQANQKEIMAALQKNQEKVVEALHANQLALKGIDAWNRGVDYSTQGTIDNLDIEGALLEEGKGE